MLAELTESMRRLGAMPEDVAKAAAPAVQAQLRASASAGHAPDGTAWAPKKRGAGAPLAGAAKAITAKAVGPFVRMTVLGVEAYHHVGAGVTAREMIPVLDVPDAIAEVVKDAAGRVFERIARGGR